MWILKKCILFWLNLDFTVVVKTFSGNLKLNTNISNNSNIIVKSFCVSNGVAALDRQFCIHEHIKRVIHRYCHQCRPILHSNTHVLIQRPNTLYSQIISLQPFRLKVFSEAFRKECIALILKFMSNWLDLTWLNITAFWENYGLNFHHSVNCALKL